MAANLKILINNFRDNIVTKLNYLHAQINQVSGFKGLSPDAGQSLIEDAEGKIYYRERTDAEIKTAYESRPNTNAFTDTHKSQVDGLAASLEGKVDKVDGEGLTPAKFTQEEKDKLAAVEDPKWKGKFTTFENLTAAYPEGSGQTWHKDDAGWNANVDAGVDADVVEYIWDASDLKWVLQQGSTTAETASSVKTKYESNPDTNAFTDSHKTTVEGLPANVEPAITKKTAFNKDYGVLEGTTAEGNDQRILNGQTAFESLGDKANDSEVVKTIETSSGQVLQMDANGKVVLPEFSTGGNSDVSVESRTGSHVLKPTDQGKRLRANDSVIQNYLLPETAGFTYGKNIELKWTGLGAVKYDTAPGVTLELPAGEGKEIFGQYDYINLSPEAENVWGIAGKTKAEGFETEIPIAFAVADVTEASLYWPHIRKSSDLPQITTTKDYLVVYSSDHAPATGGGVYWGEFDSLVGNVLVGFIERGAIYTGEQAETPRIYSFPTSETGLATDDIFITFHIIPDPGQPGVQVNKIISCSGGDLHTATWTDRGNPTGAQAGETHQGYLRIRRRGANDYVGISLTVGGSPGEFKVCQGTSPLAMTNRLQTLDGSEGMTNGDVYIRGQIQYFEYNSNAYGLIGLIKSNGDRYFAIANLDTNGVPTSVEKVIYKADLLRNLEDYIENGVVYILWKKGLDNADNLYDFTMERFNLSDLL